MNLRWDSPRVALWRAAVAEIITSTGGSATTFEESEPSDGREDQGCVELEGAELWEKPISDFSTSWPGVDHPE